MVTDFVLPCKNSIFAAMIDLKKYMKSVFPSNETIDFKYKLAGVIVIICGYNYINPSTVHVHVGGYVRGNKFHLNGFVL